jgi:lipid-binding SYLF domain-containing protein
MRTHFLPALALGIAAMTAAPASAAPPIADTLAHADEVLAELSKIPEKGIPPALLKNAEAVAIIPRVIKAGFVVAGRGGRGVVLIKDKNGAWGNPVLVNFGGGSVGFQVGVSATDVVLVFRQRKTLDRLLEGKKKFTLGGDASVAAGPVGRTLSAETDGKLEAEIVSYSRSRGLFAGVSVSGAILNIAQEDTERLRTQPTKTELKNLNALLARLAEMSVEPPTAGTVPPASVPVKPPQQ